MKPAPFDYVSPTSVEEAVEALGQDGAVVLAGGQSLVLELVQRDQRPRLVVDVNGLHGLAEVRQDDLASPWARSSGTHARAGRGRPRTPAARRGGAVRRAPADPCAWHVLRFAGLGPPGRGVERGGARPRRGGARARDRGGAVVAAEDWFVGERRTSRRPDELVVEVVLPMPEPGSTVGFAEHGGRTPASPRSLSSPSPCLRDGQVERVRLAVAGLADRPGRLPEVEEALVGVAADRLPARAREEVRRRLGRDDHRAALAAELAGRALTGAVAA